MVSACDTQSLLATLKSEMATLSRVGDTSLGDMIAIAVLEAVKDKYATLEDFLKDIRNQ